MDAAAMYEFDVNGVIIFRNVLAAETVQRMNSAIDGAGLAGTETPAQSNGGFGFPVPWAADPIFLETMAGEAVLSVARVMCGDWLRLDHAYGIQMNNEWDGNANLHGGARTDQGEHQYQWHQNRMYNGLIVVMFALHPVREGDGGFICVPGSHRANVPFRPPVDHSMVINPTLEPGDMLCFTGAHGSAYRDFAHHAQSAAAAAVAAAAPPQQILLRAPFPPLISRNAVLHRSASSRHDGLDKRATRSPLHPFQV